MTEHPARNVSLEEMDMASHIHPYSSLADNLATGPTRIVAEADRITVTDSQGNQCIDAMAALWCVNIGYSRNEIADAVSEQMRKMSFFHSFATTSNEPAIRLADRLLGLLPDNMSKVFFGNTGSDANDTNVKFVWYYNNLRGMPLKKKIIARQRGYHGSTVVAASLTGLPMLHNAFDLPIDGIIHTLPNHYYRQAEPGMSELEFSRHLAVELDALIEREGPDTVAAFIAEPVMGAGGVIVPPEGYFPEIQKVLDKHDVLMIADEVICGFGRTGKWFGSYTYDIKPDLMTLAKGLTSAYIPMSASIISEKVWKVLVDGSPTSGPFGHGMTYGAHPVAAAAALANLDILEGEDLVGNSERVGAYLQTQLRENFADHPLVGEIRGRGLSAAIELVKNKETKEEFDMDVKLGLKLMAACLDEGLNIQALLGTNTTAFSPALVVAESDIDEILTRYGRGLDKVFSNLKSEGLWDG